MSFWEALGVPRDALNPTGFPKVLIWLPKESRRISKELLKISRRTSLDANDSEEDSAVLLRISKVLQRDLEPSKIYERFMRGS